MTLKTIMDNSLVTAINDVEGLPEFVHWRPGLYKIARVEESGFYAGLNLKGRDFKSLDELNRYMERLTAGGRPMPKAPPETPFEKAQALVYETIDAPRKKRIEKAREALAIYPGCADAWVILSEYEKDPKARKGMLEEAVRAGEIGLKDAGMAVGLTADRSERSPGERPQDESRDPSFWSTEARPYMRARLALAQLLYEEGEREKAIVEYRSMLELNPRDSQGIRYLLLSAYLEAGTDAADAEAAALVERTRDASSAWAYAKAYLLFKREGDTPASMAAGVRAYYANPLIPRVLSGEIRVPKRLPETYQYGEEDEAVIYGASAMGYWSAALGALPWLLAVVNRITGGLPTPFGTKAPSVRHRVDALWQVARAGARGVARDRHLVKALADHREFGAVWLTSNAFDDEMFRIGGVNPIHHVVMHSAIEEILDMPDTQDKGGDVPRAMRATVDSLVRAGLSRHEAVHLITFVYAFDWLLAAKDVRPFDVEAQTARLRYVGRLASGEVSPDAVLTTPSRNDPCPCGSGRKFKKCCGKTDNWPIPHVVALAREIGAGRGKVRSRQNLGLSSVMGDGKYAGLDELIKLPEGHPLVILENTAFVAEELMRQGREFQAYLAFRDNVELARTLADEDHLATALEDAVDALGGEAGFHSEVSQYACELARLVADPREASRLWGVAAEAFMMLDKMPQAGEALDRAMSAGRPHPFAVLVRARYLSNVDRHDGAAEAYREVIKGCASSTGREYQEMAEQARAELRQLERRKARKARPSS